MEALVKPEFWRGRRVLLTGHTGFKGAWLSLWLQRMGAQVFGFALQPVSSPNLFELANVAEGMEHRIGDIRDAKAVQAAVAEAKPEIVFHMAAQSLVRQSYADPLGTFSTNVIGTAHVLDACRDIASLRAVVVVTSDKCYANTGPARGYQEADPLGGDDPYSASKGAAELVAHSYRTSFFASEGAPRVATARAGNVIGGGDWSADRLLSDFFQAAARRQPLRIRQPQAIRPWQFVLEPLRGYLMLAERLVGEGDAAQAWNFGPKAEDTRSVEWVIDQLRALWLEPVDVQIDRGSHLKESAVLKLDCSKAETELGWHPSIGLQQALERTADWYREVASDPSTARGYTLEQIESYVAGASPVPSPQALAPKIARSGR